MKFLLLIVLAFSIHAASAQQVISIETVKDHVGDSVTVTAKVFGVKYFSESKNAPTLVNLGAAFPNQLLTVVIYGDDRERLKLQPETDFKDKEITVTGTVQLYRDKPQIIIRDAAQFTIKN